MIANSSSNISVATVTLTSTQLKALDSVPILIIPAQGAGSIIAPISVQAKFVCPTGEAFTITNDISLLVTDLSGQSYASLAATEFDSVTVDTYCTTNYGQLSTIDASVFENTNAVLGILAGSITGNPANDNTIIVSVLYKVFLLK